MQVIFTAPSSPENYYHAINDYFVPYFHLFQSPSRANTNPTVVVKTPHSEKFSLFQEILAEVLPNHRLIFDDHSGGKAIPIQRMTAGLRYTRTIARLSKHICRNLRLPHIAHGVVLISRRDAPRNESVADGRPHIRTIDNNEELVSEVQRLCQARGVQFHNVYNEDLSFIEQLQLYHQTKFIIGQHGAGLTNVMWMQRGGHCFEIQCSKRLPYFRQMARAKQIAYREVTPLSTRYSLPIHEMLDNEIGRDEIATVTIRDILTPLSKLLQS